MAHFNNDEDLSDAVIYRGLKDCCDQCGKKFQLGDLISVSGDGGLAFCLFSLVDIENSEIPCLLKWALANDQVVNSPKVLFYDGD